ncbi:MULTISPECIES: hypothetical protein [unclassified Paenibacillus]|uniref:hypothetical protein n=1 Tax=unclassified Paenibacillus TaxID=185978 RepID=UPI0038366107
MNVESAIGKVINTKFTLEKDYSKITNNLNWTYTDVLYSFQGVYVIGLNIFYEDEFVCCGKQIKPKKHANNRQIVYSHKYIKENYHEFDKLNKLPELLKFIDVYSDLGNIIPIWPGGNSHRGMSQCYDIPDIYFNKKEIKEYASYFYNNFLSDKNFFLDDVLSGEFSKFEIGDYLRFSKEDYIKFLNHIVRIIKMRSEQLKQYI